MASSLISRECCVGAPRPPRLCSKPSSRPLCRFSSRKRLPPILAGPVGPVGSSSSASSSGSAVSEAPRPRSTSSAASSTADSAVVELQLDAGVQVRVDQLLQQAYRSGFEAGYTAGVKVTVSVDVDTQGELQPSSSSSGRGQLAAGPSGRPGDAPTKAADSLGKSALKALIWRVFSTSATVAVALVVLHDSLQVQDALKFGGLEFVTKYVLYFAHERLWAWLPAVL